MSAKGKKKPDAIKVAKLVEEFKEKRPLYDEFCKGMVRLLEAFLEQADVRYQTVTYRVKESDSLAKKLTQNLNMSHISALNEIYDLSGCRIIFYLESERDKFASFLADQLGEENTQTISRQSDDDYNAIHIIANLGQDRISLPEYSKFDSLKCEIQLTTVLDHGWTELNHKIVYKPERKLQDFDRARFEKLGAMMRKIMKDEIKKAKDGLEFVNKSHEHLLQGKLVFDPTFFTELKALKTVDELIENLSLLSQMIADFPDNNFLQSFNLIEIIEYSIKKGNSDLKQSLIASDINTKLQLLCITILNQIRYLDSEGVYKTALNLIEEGSDEVKSSAKGVIEKLGSFDKQIIEKIGYVAQQTVISKLEETVENEPN